MAKVVPEYLFAGLAGTAAPPEFIDLDMEDPTVPMAADLVERGVAEDAALAIDGITNSEGAEASFGRSEPASVMSAGSPVVGPAVAIRSCNGDRRPGVDMQGTMITTARSISRISMIQFASAVVPPSGPSRASIRSAEDGKIAGGVRSACRGWDSGHLAGAINGATVARGTTFLKDKLHQPVFLSGIDIHDDPRRVRGLRSRAFDAEGTPTAERLPVRAASSSTWALDFRSARQLALVSTGHAAEALVADRLRQPRTCILRRASSPWRNSWPNQARALHHGDDGSAVNGLTGDYSRGAAGFMIRDGALAEPVAEITVAGNLQGMFASLVAANHLTFRRGVDSPMIRIEGMTLAGA